MLQGVLLFVLVNEFRIASHGAFECLEPRRIARFRSPPLASVIDQCQGKVKDEDICHLAKESSDEGHRRDWRKGSDPRAAKYCVWPERGGRLMTNPCRRGCHKRT